MNVYVYLPKYLTQLNKTLIYLSQNKKKQPWNENKTKDLHQLRTHKFK